MGLFNKCPIKIPDIASIWEKPLRESNRNLPVVAFTIPQPLADVAGKEHEEERSIPVINYGMPRKFVKAPNGCVSTQFQRNRLYEMYFPYSHVKVNLGKNQFADEVDRFGGFNFSANYHGAVKHHGPFNDVIMEEKEAWANPNQPVMQITMPFMFFTDDPEVWLDVVPSDRNAGKNLPISLIGGFMPIHAWTRGLSWAFEWTDTTQDTLELNHDTVMFNILFSKPVKIEFVEWNEKFSKRWNMIVGSAINRRETNTLYTDALARRPKKLLPKKKWFKK
tara:strand:- start:6126 stop:6959 length:834 start_codon:yes stop_codon:yes gene_type:complete